MEENNKQAPSQAQSPQTPALSSAQTTPTGNIPNENIKSDIYPQLVIKNNENPNKLYAFPFIGWLIKVIMLIPVFIVNALLGFVVGVLWLITPFVILFTRRYWHTAFEITHGYLIYTTKIGLFLYGLSDKYPGFNLEPNGIFELHMEKPVAPSRLLAFPILGILIRIVLLFPYYIYQLVLLYGAYFATFASWFAVTIKGKYPESLHEFNRDALRVSLAYTMYLTYLSDKYPSFWISMKHKTVKIILIVISVLYILTANVIDFIDRMQHPQDTHQQSSQDFYDTTFDY